MISSQVDKTCHIKPVIDTRALLNSRTRSEPEVFSRPHAVGFVDRNLTANPPQPHR